MIPVCIVLPIIINGLVCLDLQFRYWGYLILQQSLNGLSNWQLIFKEQTMFYFSELCLLFVAAIVYQSFAVEKKSNAWMLVMSSPYKEKKVIYGKYVVCVLNMLILLLTNSVTLAISGYITGVEGGFELSLFIRALLVLFFASALMTSFFIFLITVLKKTIYIIPISIVILFLASELYYPDAPDVSKFLIWYPFTYGSHCFRATNSEMIVVVLVSLVLSGLFLFLSCLTVKKKEVLE